MEFKNKPKNTLSTGKGHSIIESYCEKNKHNLVCVKEENPLGTFGAISNVASRNFSEDYLILNGDTIFDANFKYIYESYKKDPKNSPLILLKEDPNHNNSGGYKKVKINGFFL